VATGQTIETKIVVDGKQAIAEMAKFDQEMKAAEQATREADAALKAFEKTQKEATAAVTAIDQRIAKYERDIVALANAVASGTGNTKAYEAELRQLSRELDALNGKTVATTNKTRDFARAAADVETHGRNGGMAMLEMSRAFEDAQYGISGVLNNIPGLLMSLGAGAGLTGIVSAAAVGVSILAKNFGGVDPAAKEAASAAKEHIKTLRDEIKDLQVELRVLEVGAERAAMEAQASAVQAAQAAFLEAAEPIGGPERFRRLRDNEKLVGTIAEQMKTATEAANRLELEVSKLAGMRRKQLEEQAQRDIDLAVDRANAITEIEEQKRDEASKETADAAKREADARYEIYVAGLKDEEDQLRDMRKAARKREEDERKQDAKALVKETRDLEREKNKAAKEAARERERIAKEEAKAKAEAEKQFTQMFISAGQQAAATALSTSQDYIEAKIKGEKDAEQKAVASFLSATGQQLVGSGTRAIFEGLIMSSNPLTPGMGAGMIATGAAAIAVGMGMGAGGAAMAHTAAGGTVGSPLPEKSASRDRGASPRSSSGGGSGGPLVINVSYGVGGPLPEDTAREIAKVMRTGDRRRGAA
jgi:hypothetical protein